MESQANPVQAKMLQLETELEYRVRVEQENKYFLSRLKLLEQELQYGLDNLVKALYLTVQCGFEGMVKELKLRLRTDAASVETDGSSTDLTSESDQLSDEETQSLPENDPEMVRLVAKINQLWAEWQCLNNVPEDETASVRQEATYAGRKDRDDDEEGGTSVAYVHVASPEGKCCKNDSGFMLSNISKTPRLQKHTPELFRKRVTGLFCKVRRRLHRCKKQTFKKSKRDNSSLQENTDVQETVTREEKQSTVDICDEKRLRRSPTHVEPRGGDLLPNKAQLTETDSQCKEEDEQCERDHLTEGSVTLVRVTEELDVYEEETDWNIPGTVEPQQQQPEGPSGWFSSKVVKGVCAGVAGVGAVAVALRYFR